MQQLNYHQAQQFYRNAILSPNKRYIACVAARRCGKSEILSRTIVNIAARAYGNYLIYANTLSQCKRVYIPAIQKLFSHSKNTRTLLKTFNKSELIFELYNGSKIFLGSAENLKTYEGIDYTIIAADECSDMPPDCFPIDAGLFPALSRTNGKAILIGAPKRFGASGARFKRLYEDWSNHTDDSLSPYAGYTWTAAGLLDEAVLAVARETMDEKDYQEQYHGTFANVSGGVYHAFNIDSVVHNTEFIDAPIYVACDFNVTPMCWVLLQQRDTVLTAVDEIVINETNTYETAGRLKKRLQSLPYELEFYGDASGRARKTSAIASDWDILLQNFPDAKLYAPRSNPPVERRVASVNAAFRNGKLKIDVRCKHLIRDLETLAYKTSSPVFDLRDPTLSHATDALGYCVYTRSPIQDDNPLPQTPASVHVEPKETLPKNLSKYDPAKKASVKASPMFVSVKR